MTEPTKPTEPLDKVAKLSLTIGRMLLEWGANAHTVQTAIASAARGLECDTAEVYCQHAAVMVMLRRGNESCMQMGKVGEHGINLRRAEALLRVVDEIVAGHLDCDGALARIAKIPTDAGAYPTAIVCLSTGLGCAAFGRLLGTDTVAFAPILVGAAAGQFLRHTMLTRKMNLFLMVTVVSFVSALIAGLSARALGDSHLEITTIASILLLVPGPAVLNAQVDAIDGRPNLAAARALRVAFILLFMTLGFLVAQRVLNV